MRQRWSPWGARVAADPRLELGCEPGERGFPATEPDRDHPVYAAEHDPVVEVRRQARGRGIAQPQIDQRGELCDAAVTKGQAFPPAGHHLAHEESCACWVAGGKADDRRGRRRDGCIRVVACERFRDRVAEMGLHLLRRRPEARLAVSEVFVEGGTGHSSLGDNGRDTGARVAAASGDLDHACEQPLALGGPLAGPRPVARNAARCSAGGHSRGP